MTGFDAVARSFFPSGEISPYGPDDAVQSVVGIVFEVVDVCGYKVMADIAYQYPEPLYSSLMETARYGLGSLSLEPAGLRCADLRARGFGPKDAVDYWFLWGAPDLMDVDLNGIPCQTVWPDVERYMPAYF